MKNFFITAFLSLFIFSNAFAQLQTNKSAPKLGYKGSIDIGNGDRQFSLNFDATDSILPIGTLANDGKGLLSIVLSSEAPVGKVTPINNRKADNWGSNCNIHRFRTIEDLLNFSVVDTEKIYSTKQQYWKPTNVIIDNKNNPADHVFAAYPGMYKKVSLGFQASIDGGGLKSDISFELMTANVGNTGKAATYKMIVSVGKESKFGSAPFSTVADMDAANFSKISELRTAFGNESLWVIDSIYTTSLTETFVKQKINIAESIGVQPGFFNGKKVYVTLYTTGTGTNIEPGVFDPVIAVDNVEGVYAPAGWALPANVVANTIIDHNNGTPVVDANGSTDYTAGTPVNVPKDTVATIKLYLTSVNRASVLTITEANSGGVSNPKYSFASTGAIKAKAANGTYSVEVPYTYAPSEAGSKFLLTIPTPENFGISNDTLEVSISVNVAADITALERLEINNGVRFWYDIAAKGITTLLGVSPVKTLKIYSIDNKIIVNNANDDVVISDLSGKTISKISSIEATKGVSLKDGVYIVKAGDKSEKILVR